MTPPRMRHLLTVEQESPAATGWGDDDPAAAWATVTTVWGNVKPLSGTEYEQAQQMDSKTTHTITTRWFDGADPQMRLVHGSRTFHPQSVHNIDEHNRFLEWRCEEVTSG